MSQSPYNRATKWQNKIVAKLKSIPAETTDWPIFHQECVALLTAYHAEMEANGINQADSLILEQPPTLSTAQKDAAAKLDPNWINKYYHMLGTTCLVEILEAYVAGETSKVGTKEEVRSVPEKFRGQWYNLLEELRAAIVQRKPWLDFEGHMRRDLERCFKR